MQGLSHACLHTFILVWNSFFPSLYPKFAVSYRGDLSYFVGDYFFQNYPILSFTEPNSMNQINSTDLKNPDCLKVAFIFFLYSNFSRCLTL